MKKLIFLLACFSLLLLHAQEPQQAPEIQSISTENTDTPPVDEQAEEPVEEPPPTIVKLPPPDTSDWQNWTFAGTALVTAAIGILVIAFNNGSSAPTAH